jgi:hypothetical protein
MAFNLPFDRGDLAMISPILASLTQGQASLALDPKRPDL